MVRALLRGESNHTVLLGAPQRRRYSSCACALEAGAAYANSFQGNVVRALLASPVRTMLDWWINARANFS